VGNKSAGISSGGTNGAIVSNNNVISNGGFGLVLVVDGYSGNVIKDNVAGTVSGPGVELGPNLCDGTTTCP
jgi:hypothetical protein